MQLRPLVFLAIAACHGSAPPAKTAEVPGGADVVLDGLWALAPADATVGIVGNAAALGAAKSLLTTVKPSAGSEGVFAAAREQLGALAELSSVPWPELGIDPAKGFAMFATPKGRIVVLPVASRDQFIGRVHGVRGTGEAADLVPGLGTCKPVELAYACASDAALLEHLGGGGALAATVHRVGERGDLEVSAERLVWAHAAATVRITRGAVLAHAVILGIEPAGLARFGPPVKIADPTAAGFGVFDLGPAVADLPAVPLAEGVTLADVAHALGGAATMRASAGTGPIDLTIAMPLRDPRPVRTMLAACEAVASKAGVPAKVVGSHCRVSFPMLRVSLDAWLDDHVLHIAAADGPVRPPPPVTLAPIPAFPLREELAQGAWSFALWGRGALFTPQAANEIGFPTELARMQLLDALFDEVGFGVRRDGDAVRIVAGVRTAWASSDAVVNARLAITPLDILGTAAVAKTAAAALPGSLLADDIAAGHAGRILPDLVVQLGLRFVVPALAEPAETPKPAEGTHVQPTNEALKSFVKLTTGASRAQKHTGKFPIGEAPLPKASCCAAADRHCAAADWSGSPWKELGFDLDGPTDFRYSYSSADGTTFHATAVGDLDCDGTEVTYQLDGKIENGQTLVKLTSPTNTD
ncbi:MAG TPA: hypothetical protein VGM88_19605 [Kofleriaceae bacterium]